MLIKKSMPVLLATLYRMAFFFSAPCAALETSELLVVGNRHAWDSIDIAKIYMEKRGVSEKNLFKIIKILVTKRYRAMGFTTNQSIRRRSESGKRK